MYRLTSSKRAERATVVSHDGDSAIVVLCEAWTNKVRVSPPLSPRALDVLCDALLDEPYGDVGLVDGSFEVPVCQREDTARAIDAWLAAQECGHDPEDALSFA